LSAQPALLAESRSLVPIREAEGAKNSGRFRIMLIEADVQGSSGYYSADVLKRDGAKAFPAGTHVFVDHPTESEEWERPERSVRDLAGYTLGAAQFEEGPDGRGLFAVFQSFPNWSELVEAWKDHVGMSIRALGLMDENGHVTELIRGESVDIVTRAGAGGRLVAMTESARQGNDNKPIYELSPSDRGALTTLNENMGTLAGVVDGLVTKITALEEKAAVAEQADVLTAGQVFAKLSATDLPAAVKARLADGYKKGVDLDAQITEQQAIVEEIKASLGGAPTADTAATDTASTASTDTAGTPAADTAGAVAPVAEAGRVDLSESEKTKRAEIGGTITNIFGGVA
jgi:hypothetical protein